MHHPLRLHRTAILAAALTAAFSLSVLAADPAASAAGKPNPVKTGIAKALGKLRADSDMLDVLNAHAGLNPKAIEKVDGPTARAYAGQRLKQAFGS